MDYAGPRLNEGSKGVLLGLGEKRRELPTEFTGSPAKPAGEVHVFTAGALCVGGPAFADDEDAAARVAADPAFADWPLVVLVDDPAQAARSAMNFLWTTFTRFDPARDMHARSVDLVHHHPSFTPPIVIDARMKPSYPVELFCDPDTAATVDRRWKEYFPNGGVEMGDSSLGHLTPTR